MDLNSALSSFEDQKDDDLNSAADVTMEGGSVPHVMSTSNTTRSFWKFSALPSILPRKPKDGKEEDNQNQRKWEVVATKDMVTYRFLANGKKLSMMGPQWCHQHHHVFLTTAI